MRRQAIRQRELFEPTPTSPTPQLPEEVKEQLRQSLVQWLQSLGRAIGKEDGDE